MNEKTNEIGTIFLQLAELRDQTLTEQESLSLDEIEELDEIRTLREMVIEIQTCPQIFFSTT